MKVIIRLGVLDMLAVAVHEYANGTSAHDTVLEHRFSPTRMSFSLIIKDDDAVVFSLYLYF